MALLKIEKFSSPVLRKKAKPIVNFNDQNLSTLIQNMAETMYDAPGVGLAANQIGLSIQLAIIDAIWKSDSRARDLRVFINPHIIERSNPITFEEGCLSLPEVNAVTKRYNKVTVRYFDLTGKEHTLKAEGLLAVALQHETDHLNGKLYIDHLSPIKREMLIKKYKKLQSLEEEPS